VRALERTGSGFTVVTDEQRLAASAVVIATAAPAASRILQRIDATAAAAVAGLRYNPLAVVHLLAHTELRGLGYQVAFSEPLVTRGVTWNDSLFGRTGVHTAYLGGARNAWIINEDRTRIGEIATAELRAVTGATASVLSVETVRMPAWDRSWSSIAQLSLPAGLHLHTNWTERPGIPGRLAAARRLAEQLAQRYR
jgi:oxygen-dependent protoporphyrinogen oxidase